MDIHALTTTQDIETLRTLALAMVQSLVVENENICQKKRLSSAKKERRIRVLEEALLLARQHRFGRQCETLTGLQRSLFEEDTDTDIAAAQIQLNNVLPITPAVETEKKSVPVRKPLPTSLPRVEAHLSPTTTDCPDCGQALRFMRDEVSELLDYVPARFIVRRYVRPQYSCACCEQVISAPMPASIIPKGLPETGLVTQVVISKYCDYLPLYRQQSIFARHGIDIPASTQAGWVAAASVALAPLATLLQDALLTRSVLHADETPLLMLDAKRGGKARKGYLWAYVSGEKTGASIACFDSQPGRAAKYPQAYLQNWSGALISDGYAAYPTPE